MEEIMKSIDYSRNVSPHMKVSPKKAFAMPEMTAADVLEAIQDWMEKHPERIQHSSVHNQVVSCEPRQGNREE